jgi:ABC-type antimicrobial peptide transport system permease subunit
MVVASRREIAVRVALGAQPRRVAREIIARGGRLALVGIAIGAIGAALSLRAVRSLLFGVGTLEPAGYVAAAAVILLATSAAASVPARRASAVDAGSALREE